MVVGGHFRRGDFALPGKMAFGHSPARAPYMAAAIQHFRFNAPVVGSSARRGSGLLRSSLGPSTPCLRFLILGNDYDWNLASALAAAPNGSDVLVRKPSKDPAVTRPRLPLLEQADG